MTNLQQPGTNVLDPGTHSPPAPTIASINVWLGGAVVGLRDKRLESIEEVPEPEDIEVDAASSADEVS